MNVPAAEPSGSDHSLLIPGVLDHVRHAGVFTCQATADAAALARIGYGSGGGSVVIAEDTAFELGPPALDSLSLMLLAQQPGLIEDGIWIAGETAPQPGSAWPLLQVILCQITPDNAEQEFRLQAVKNLSNKVPGLMIRGLGQRGWVRVHRQLYQKEFTLTTLGSALWQAYHELLQAPCTVILAAGLPQLHERFATCAAAALLMSTKRKRLQWIERGVVSCEELDCTTCDEKPACDIIKHAAMERKE